MTTIQCTQLKLPILILRIGKPDACLHYGFEFNLGPRAGKNKDARVPRRRFRG